MIGLTHPYLIDILYRYECIEREVGESSGGDSAPVRLRQPQRMQMAMVVTCADDLVPASHSVHMVMAVAETLDLQRFHLPIQARRGVAGRNATDPKLLVAFGCALAYNLLHLGDKLPA